jgi:VWFA-related protein
VAPSPYSLRIETRLVDVGVVVRDPRGRAVPGLKQGDFQVLDDGKERAITSFLVDTVRARPQKAANSSAPTPQPSATATGSAPRPPRFVVLFFDDAGTNGGDLTRAQIAARRFVKEALNPGDRVAIMTSSSAQTLDFTTDLAKLIESIGRVKAHLRVPDGGLAACPRITPYQAYLISAKLDPMALKAAVDEVYSCNDQSPPPTLHSRGMQTNPVIQTVKGQADQTWDRVRIISESTLDALDFGVEYLGKMPGMRVMVLVSSGILAGTMERHQDLVVDHALRAGVVINSLDAKGLYSEAPVRPLGELPTMTQAAMLETTILFEHGSVGSRLDELGLPLAYFAAGTGGLFFHNNNDLDLAFHQIGVEPEVTYHLGFSPNDVAADGKYHKLKVRLATPHSNLVQARPGYFAPEHAGAPAKKSPADDRRAQLDRAVMSQEILSGFPAAIHVKSGSPITVTANVDVTQLRFLPQDGRRAQKLTFVAALLDAQGNLAAAKEGAMELALTDATFAKMALTGLNANLSLDAPPGAYRLREVIQEGVDGRIATTLQTVQIPAPR